MKLVIVESPGKINKLQNYLGKEYKVASSIGHIIDLPSKSLSIDINNKFEPVYKPLPGKTSVIKKLKDLKNKSEEVIIASDKDREGEMIGWSLIKELKLNNPKRIVFGEITKSEIQKALKNPTKLNQNLVNAQKARRILDRILGYYLSPLLWRNVLPGLSAGRVQSVVLRLIVEREKEIQKFLESDIPIHYKYTGEFLDKKIQYKSVLYKKKSIAKLKTKKDAEDFLKKCTQSEFKVLNIDKTIKKKNPSRPFTTSTLQQDAGSKLGFNVKRTMMAAQHLYEAGYITYMRTDSVHLSNEIIKNIGKYIRNNFGNEFHKETYYKTKGNNTQEAHEAIRPTKIETKNVIVKGKIKNDEKRLYSLIWKRTIASQMESAVYDVTSISIEISKCKEYIFKTVFDNLKFPGFLIVYNFESNSENEEKNIKLPAIGTILNPIYIKGITEFKSPPTRYNEPGLVKELDPETGLNIGRPATYSQIVSKIQDKKYVEFKDIEGKDFEGENLIWNGKKITKEKITITLGKEKNKLFPTSLGNLVTEYLISKFPNIMDYKFTSDMENSLDNIANGDKEWRNVLQKFYDKFVPIVEKVKKEKNIMDNKTKILGKIDGEDVIAKIGKYGPYIQLSENTVRKSPIKPPLTFESIKLEDAKELLKYPKIIGKIGINQVLLKKGKYGLYISVGKNKISIDDENITLEEIKDKLKNKKDNSLKKFKEKTKIYKILKGPYGKFINVTDSKNMKLNYNVHISDNINIENLTLDDIKKIIDKYFENKKNKK